MRAACGMRIWLKMDADQYQYRARELFESILKTEGDVDALIAFYWSTR